MTSTTFETKDSGERVDYPSGMRRDVDTGKARYDLVDRPMLKRIAELYGRGAEKYGDNNWRLADSEAELARFKASGFRHFMSWMNGEEDEDHGAAVFFNIAAAEMVKAKIEEAKAAEKRRADADHEYRRLLNPYYRTSFYDEYYNNFTRANPFRRY